VRTAVHVVASGGSAGDAALAAERLGGSLQNAFVAPGGPAGRIPVRTGWTLYRFAGGAATPVSECASESEAVELMNRLAVESYGPISAAVGYAGRTLEPAADRLAHRLAAADGVRTVERYRVGASVGAHTGPDSFGLFWWPVV
jgi:hypothetical protein